MTTKQDQLLLLLQDNLKKKEGSFYYKLCEEHIFHNASYNEFALTTAYISNVELDEQIRVKCIPILWEIGFKVLSCISSHYNPIDVYCITNVKDHDLDELTNRIYYLCNFFTNGNEMDYEYLAMLH
ncbi:MAG: hypothetical protein IM638_03080 [Bacteroidetes bacterium]|nr:hypothetical protein [Bacteroidota bacterium]